MCLALLIGALWGSLPVQGLSGLLFAIAAIAGLQSGFLQVWLSIDPEDYGGALTLLFEGAMPTFALFMVRRSRRSVCCCRLLAQAASLRIRHMQLAHAGAVAGNEAYDTV